VHERLKSAPPSSLKMYLLTRFLPYGEIMHRAGIRAVQSTALRSTSGALIGVLSTHSLRCQRPTDFQLRAINDVARAGANKIIALRARGNGNAAAVEDPAERVGSREVVQWPYAWAVGSSELRRKRFELADAEQRIAFNDMARRELEGLRKRNRSHPDENIVGRPRRLGWEAKAHRWIGVMRDQSQCCGVLHLGLKPPSLTAMP
jgi:hypothetical protein